MFKAAYSSQEASPNDLAMPAWHWEGTCGVQDIWQKHALDALKPQPATFFFSRHAQISHMLMKELHSHASNSFPHSPESSPRK